eukprot:m.57254 g.57254  ORF g.57254 m.57254 type:complete len:113 (+) comp49017_c0_seq4:38-376(+)
MWRSNAAQESEDLVRVLVCTPVGALPSTTCNTTPLLSVRVECESKRLLVCAHSLPCMNARNHKLAADVGPISTVTVPSVQRLDANANFLSSNLLECYLGFAMRQMQQSVCLV